MDAPMLAAWPDAQQTNQAWDDSTSQNFVKDNTPKTKGAFLLKAEDPQELEKSQEDSPVIMQQVATFQMPDVMKVISDAMTSAWNAISESGLKEYCIKWWDPKNDGKWNRAELAFGALVHVANSVAKVTFSIISFIPGSSSETVKNFINIDSLANKGFLDEKDSFPLSLLFKAFAETVNFNAEFSNEKQFRKKVKEIETSSFVKSIFNYGETLAKSENVLTRNLGARVVFLGGTLVHALENLSRFAAGVLLAGASTLTLFSDKKLNDLAAINLQGSMGIEEFLAGMRLVAYPWQKTNMVNLAAYRADYDFSTPAVEVYTKK